MDRPKKKKPVRWLVSLHEAGHAVAAVVTGLGVRRVHASPSGFIAGACHTVAPRTDDERDAICDAAGEAALELYSPGIAATLDRFLSPLGKVAMRNAGVVYESMGLAGSPADDLPPNDGQNIQRAAVAAGSPEANHAYYVAIGCKAVDILEANWRAVIAIAEELYDHGEISGERVGLIVRGTPADPTSRSKTNAA